MMQDSKYEMNSNPMNNLAKKYQQKTDKQHILDNPDTYIGSVEQIEDTLWVYDELHEKISLKKINFIPGLYKLFDEGIVNCRDHVIRMIQSHEKDSNNHLVTSIDITIDDQGVITMMNDGNGVDIEKHPESNIWIPELIFGHLRTSTNYDKSEKKIVGGKNGFGFKLVMIWSEYGSIETVDHTRGLKYTQTFCNNLNEIRDPDIKKCKKKPYTKISFKPDYKRLGIDNLSKDFISLLRRRVLDVAGVTEKSIKVKYNNDLVPIKTFQNYIDMYIGDKSVTPRVFESGNERWDYCVAITPVNEFSQVSFVNGIWTCKGGKHVEYILNQITKKVCTYIEKKKKITCNPSSIKEQLILFVRCDIENPSFDSQTKDYMNTPSTKFGSKCDVSDKFIEKVAKMGIMDTACALTELKETKVAAKKTDGSKTKTIRGITKLTDANWAGTAKSGECTIIFCEGDSAKAGILSGMSSDDRNVIGVYPMKGKLLNVRGEQTKKIADNKEITEIKKILGLENGKEYKNIEDIKKCLRYGKILFMTDQDLDGSHIKGLGINLFQSIWSSLCKIEGFIGFMNTPILKATKANQQMLFYNDGEYNEWKTQNQNSSSWKIKYYKGLGTSTGKEFKEYFKNKKIVNFTHSGEVCDNSIDMIFNKKRSDDRKIWLENDYSRDSYLDTNSDSVSYKDFINREFIHFSKYDCDRSIPNLMDGLKISLRKILYAAFKKNLVNEIKVAQFSGYVSEHSCYHHGEASLNQAIKGMAQNYVGSNNINLLVPNGQFGTRLQGGEDSASERYIFTYLNPITRTLFPDGDDAILNYLDDDGTLVEPTYYAPILPNILINGSKGIGTGFSTDVMCYNPLDLLKYIKHKLNPIVNQKFDSPFIPYYQGFMGTIEPLSDTKFLIKGIYEKIGQDKIRVTELPVGYWTQDFKEHIECLIESIDKNGKKNPSVVKDYDDMSKDTTVDFTIYFQKNKLDELESNTDINNLNGVHKLLKLASTHTNTNMHLFDANDKLKKYNSIDKIIDDYYDVRISLYEKRKAFIIDKLENELVVLTNKARYIKETLDNIVDLRRKSSNQINDMLSLRKYTKIEESYKYLTKMPMDSVNNENVSKLFQQKEEKIKELDIVKTTSIQDMWLNELSVFEDEYTKYKEYSKSNQSTEESTSNKKKGTKKVKTLIIE